MANVDPRSERRIAAAEKEIEELGSRIRELKREIERLRELPEAGPQAPADPTLTPISELPTTRVQGTPRFVVTRLSSPEEKIAVFRSLFTGRDDVYATRWVSAKTGRSGWSPAVRGGFYTDAVTDSDLLPLTDQIINQHLRGVLPSERTDLHVGLYPMHTDDTCRLLVCDFDDGDWRADASAYVSACSQNGIQAAAEISRSGEGAHVWIFFSEHLSAHIARSLGTSLLREAMNIRGLMSLSSYDRFFPSQDSLPRKSSGRMRLGNLIALPLQGTCRAKGTTVFADPDTWQPFVDQFAFLSSITRLSPEDVVALASKLRPVRTGPIASTGARPAKQSRTPDSPATTGASHRAPVTITLSSTIAIPTEGLPAGVIAELKHAASLPNPEFFRRQAQRFSTFGTPRYVYCFEHDGTQIRVPRGLLDSVRRTLSSAHIGISIVNEIGDARAITPTFLGGLNPDQQTAVAAMQQHETGVLVAPPGSGKTVMACATIVERAVSTAIIVNRAELATQWRERLTEFLDIDPKLIGQLGAGRRKRTGIIDIIMLQSIARKDADPSLLNDYGYVIVDECHSLGAPSTEAAIRQIRVRYWLGLTATPYRADQMDDIITMQCGPIRHTIVSTDESDRQLVIHDTEFVTDEWGADGPSIQAMYGELASNETRNQGIANDIHDAYREGRTCLALTNRIEHVDTLAALLRALNVRVFVLHGQLGARERLAVRAETSAMDGQTPFVLIATDKVAGEGFDLPQLDTLFLTMPISFKGRVIQQVGRVTRLNRETLFATQVHDYRDARVPLFERMFNKRQRIIAKQGFTASATVTK
ncbi:MAG TPA: helicase [Microbacteriaceae bacterium]|jgi:superfamily II DNA or RNA helicase|nr:helicase [Microbacteriaceae bacterium]